MSNENLSIETRALHWLMSGDTGASSKSICAHMQGIQKSDYASYPRDPADLGRCLRLLEIMPEWKPRIQEMAVYGPGWAGQVAVWQELRATMDNEVGIDWSKGNRAPITYNAMQLAQADGYRNDPNYECQFREDGTMSSARIIAREAKQ